MSKIAYITAIYGNYEKSCKTFSKQTIDSDFICFTDDSNIKSNGWEIDTTPYHILFPSKQDDGTKLNSIANNKHTFNVAKYYKQAWKNIPRLKEYDIVVWLDGTIAIKNEKCSSLIYDKTKKYHILSWNHEMRNGLLIEEVKASTYGDRYCSTGWNGQQQPFQDVVNQYQEYLKEGYDENFWKNFPRAEGRGDNINFGVWVTCFVSFCNRDEKVTKFLDFWYNQTLKYTTQDQISFSKTAQDTKLIPYTLPDKEIKGSRPHEQTDLFIKMHHGL